MILDSPTNIGTAGATPTATPLVVISADGGQNFGLLYRFLSLSLSISTPDLTLGQPIAKCTLVMLVGSTQLSSKTVYSVKVRRSST